MISTVIDQSLGLEYPIFQGGMAWVADASLAAGVSNAGGLGLIAAMNSNGEQLRAEIRKCKELTDKPFGTSYKYSFHITQILDKDLHYNQMENQNPLSTYA